MTFAAPLRILAVAAICVLALVVLVINESRARADGIEVILEMEAVDPRALLSGHYVILGFAETMPPDQDCLAAAPSAAEDTPPLEHTWLALRPDGALHRLAGSGATREEALGHGPVAVRGTSFCNPRILDEKGVAIQPATQRLDLGVDRFHINQTEAERIDALLRAQTSTQAQRVFAIVSVGRDGRARLIGLQIDGERLELSWS